MGVVPRWGLAVVRGESMTPTLYPGDRIFIAYRRTPVVGDVVTATSIEGDLVVKRATARTERGGDPAWTLSSDNPAAPGAKDSRGWGAFRDRDVHGIVLARLWPRPGRVRRQSSGV